MVITRKYCPDRRRRRRDGAPRSGLHAAHGAHGHYNAVIHVERPARSVTIRDLTVDGGNRGRDETRFTGIIYDEVGGVCERVEIKRLTETPVSGRPDRHRHLLVLRVRRRSRAHDARRRHPRVPEVRVRLLRRRLHADRRTCHRRRLDAQHRRRPERFRAAPRHHGTLTDCVARRCWYDGDPVHGLTACGYILYYGYPGLHGLPRRREPDRDLQHRHQPGRERR